MSCCCSNNYVNIWAATWQNQQSECAPSEDSDQPGHPPSLIRVFAVRMKKHWALSYPLSTQRRLQSDWADAQADLSLRWAHTHFLGFVMSWLILLKQCMTLLHIHKMYKGWLCKLFIKVFMPRHQKVAGYYVIPSEILSVRPSVRPFVHPSAPTTILVSATPPTVLGQSFWNLTGVLRMVWRYAYCFFRILKLFFITFFPFLT